MPMITAEKIDHAKLIIDSLVKQGSQLFSDVAETAQELARLSTVTAEQNAAISVHIAEARDLNSTIFDLRSRIAEMAEANARLEAQLADANERLTMISQTAQREPPAEEPAAAPARTNGNGAEIASAAGLVAMEKLAATRGPIA